jgi:hypothetical protein
MGVPPLSPIRRSPPSLTALGSANTITAPLLIKNGFNAFPMALIVSMRVAYSRLVLADMRAFFSSSGPMI